MIYNAGLVLEGGGMRAVYTNGVLDYLMENNIDFSYVVGVSAGCGTGMNFISKQIGRMNKISTEYGNDKRMIGFNNLIKHGSYFNLNFLYNELDKTIPFDYETFYGSSNIFKVGCFNLETGMVDYFDKEDLKNSLDPLIASNSLPLISKIVRVNSIKYLDGGIKDSIPLNKSIKDGNKKNVVILTNPSEYRRKPESSINIIKVLYFKYPKLIEALKQRHIVYNNMLDKLEIMEANNEVFIIRPSVALNVSRYTKDVESLNIAYEQGRLDAQKMIQDLLVYLNE